MENMKQNNRIIGRFDGDEEGPLIIAIGGTHGNEPAGVHAIQQLLVLLEQERISNPGFIYRGTFIGVIGNVSALDQQVRFHQKDLNRSLIPNEIVALRQQPIESLRNEDKEAVQLVDCIEKEISRYKPKYMVVVDLHTTTAFGGVFSVVSGLPGARAIARDLKAPVILGFINGLAGTTLHYFTNEQMQIPTTAIVFESGQHNEPKAVDRAISALVHTMRSVGAVHPRDVEGKHNDLLQEAVVGLPEIVNLVYTHKIVPQDHFVMRPGYSNFQAVVKGEYLADSIHGPIYAPMKGLILMPLYQKQGDDGFFIVEEI